MLDDAENLTYEGAVEFQGDESNGSAFGYNANGGLITDTGKGIMHIDYDDNNYPRRIQFANGNVTEYVYSATGEKLRAVHYTAVPNIEVGSGETHELTPAEILFKDSTDYHGSLIIENGVPSQYLFDGGYCSLKDNSGNPNISYHYYDRDHLGNIRGVVDESGTVEQITNYYPFGAPYSDATTTNPTFQRYKYNGKELELMHGLKWYDYGARWYDPLLVNWNRPDPSHKDYYPWSPYAYCGDNPVNAVDPDGRNPIYNTSGKYLGYTKEGFTGQIYVYYGMETINFQDYSIDQLLDKENGYGYNMFTYEDITSSYTGEALSNFVSNVLTDIVSHFEGVSILGDTSRKFSMDELDGRIITFSSKSNANFTTKREHNGIKPHIEAHQIGGYEATVENLICSILIHEWYSHGKFKIGDLFNNHSLAYKNVMTDKLFFPKTTKKYQEFIKRNYDFYKKREKGK